MKANACGGAIKFCFPQTNGIGSMHSKLQLLKFANHLRIVVPTGNLVPYDWGETGVMENVGSNHKSHKHGSFASLINLADGLHY